MVGRGERGGPRVESGMPRTEGVARCQTTADKHAALPCGFGTEWDGCPAQGAGGKPVCLEGWIRIRPHLEYFGKGITPV